MEVLDLIVVPMERVWKGWIAFCSPWKGFGSAGSHPPQDGGGG